MERANKVLSYWDHREPTMANMYRHDQGDEIDLVERPEIMGYLPPFAGHNVLELAAGIGRFTEVLAPSAKRVTAVDIVAKFVEASKSRNTRFANIDHVCADVMMLDYPPGSFDLIFSNWLLMYLDDAEVEILAQRLCRWLAPSGHLFFRESCDVQHRHFNGQYYVHYRTAEQYGEIFAGKLTLVRQGHIAAYKTLLKNAFQKFWLYRNDHK